MVEDKQKDDIENRVYELGYLLVPTLADESLTQARGELKNLIESKGGLIITEGYPKFINLSYPIEKYLANKKQSFFSAYFGWIKFEIIPSSFLELDKNFKSSEKIIRFILIKTVRENTLAPKKIIPREIKKKEIPKEVKAVEPKEPLSAAETESIDKKIEELVA